MRKYLIILFLLISTFARAATYYVAIAAEGGNNSNPGTLAQPWLTWAYAMQSSAATAGDTVYFRGGVYPTTVTNGTGIYATKDGTSGNLLVFMAYPADFAAGDYPILDCDNTVSASGNLNYGLYCSGMNYVHFYGLHIRNVWAFDNNDECIAWLCNGSNTIIENCKIYNVHGTGLRVSSGTNFYVTNTDAYNCCDSLRATVPGNNGYGLADWNTANITGSVYFDGCRAWNCGDDGFVAYSKSYTSYNNCWGFKNGQMQGGGNGFKLGFPPSAPYAALLRKVTNCLAVYNRASGITTNDNGVESISCQVYNNTVYQNWNYDGAYTSNTYGIKIYNTTYADVEELKRIFRNNISYDNEDGEISVAASAVYTHSNNSWDIPLTIADANFQDTDSTGLTGARQADGTLPDLGGFLRPSTGSQIIGVGVAISGLVYDADNYLWDDPPAIGAYEYPPVSPTLVTSIDIWGTGGATTITIEGGTLQMIKKTLPVNATDTTCTWSVIDGSGHGTVSSSGLLTAGNNGTVTVRATANDASGIYGEEGIIISNQSPDAQLPTISTKSIGLQTSIWAWSGGDVTDDGGATVTERGVCWSTSANPTTADSHIIDSSTGEGVFDIRIIGLSGNTTYYVRAYGTNIEGTGYGTDVEWTTPVKNYVTSGGSAVTSGGNIIKID